MPRRKPPRCDLCREHLTAPPVIELTRRGCKLHLCPACVRELDVVVDGLMADLDRVERRALTHADRVAYYRDEHSIE